MIYLNTKQLSKKLNINPAKWKRWSREFLDPDPLGGFQSGYARQFSVKEAFRVFFGGYLVSELKYSIVETRQILSDLHAWLKRNGMFSISIQPPAPESESHQIFIYQLDGGEFGYAIRRKTGRTMQLNSGHWQEPYEQQWIGLPKDLSAVNDITHCRVIYIDTLYGIFLSKVNA